METIEEAWKALEEYAVRSHGMVRPLARALAVASVAKACGAVGHFDANRVGMCACRACVVRAEIEGLGE